jgi:PAS domain S-box-containing protein
MTLIPLPPASDQSVTLADVLRDIAAALNSTLDLNEVLDLILSTVNLVVPGDSVNIMLLENGVARVVRHIGFAERGLTDWIDTLSFTIAEVPGLKIMTETGQPLCLTDTATDPAWVHFPETAWQRSYAGAPLRHRERTLGFLNLYSTRPNFYTPQHAEVLLSFAHQAAIAVQNARLFKETQQRLAAQTALLSASSAISSSLDLPTVLQRCAEQLCRAIAATSAYLSYWDRDSRTTVVVAEYYSPQASEQERASAPKAGQPAAADETAWLVAGNSLIRQVDDPETPPDTRQQMLTYGVQSLLFIPLTAKGQTFGYATLWETRRRREFTSEEVQLCLGIAQQTAIAFDNARLFDTARQQLALARTLQAVGALLTSEMSLSEVFERIFDLLAEVIRYDCVAIELFDDQQEVFLAAQRGFPDPDLARRTTRDITGPGMRQRWGSHAVIVLPDTQRDPRWLDVPDFDYIRSAILVWLRAKQQAFGMLMIYSRTANVYDETTSELAVAYAHQAAIAIENAQLSGAIRQSAAQLQDRVNERTAELEQERNRTQAILDAAGEGIIFTDKYGVIEYMNPQMEQLTGYSAAETIGQTPALWGSGLTPRAVYDDLWNTIQRGKVWQGEMINRHRLGRLYDTALTVAPLRDADHIIIGYVGIQRDVSQQKELARLKDEFAASVSHEFRAPLANIKLYLRLLDSGRPEKREQYMQTLRRETIRLENLIEDLMYISRLDQRSDSPPNAPTDLHPLIAEIIADRSDLVARHGLALDYLPNPHLPLALVEPSMFAQLITNLMSNAINYTPPDGIITIMTGLRTSEEQEWVIVTVQDTGPGISAADRSRIFERFYRGEVGRKSGAPGSGLGLAICWRIAEKLEGRLTLDSEPGQGAAFTVWLKPAGARS